MRLRFDSRAINSLAGEVRAEAQRLMPGPRPGLRSVVLEPGERVIPYRPEQPRCAHQQAEPVTLSTGETVACVCIACLEPLRADYIDYQRGRARLFAFCRHDDWIDISSLGQVGATRICQACGAINENGMVS